MKHHSLLFVFLATVLLPVNGLRADRGVLPQYAPPDAYLPGDPLPYYGSENPWDRRFFDDEGEVNHFGQHELLDILEGRVDAAIAYCRSHIARDGNDLESHLMLAIALAKQGKMGEAKRELNTALDLGLPITRLMAGPRGLLEPLRATSTYRNRVAGRTDGLVHGPLLGAVTPTSARFWVRTEDESAVEVRVSSRGDFEHAEASGAARSRADVDYTAVATVAGLKPATLYTYQIRIDGRPVPRWSQWELRTYPADGTKDPVRVAFGGCAHYAPVNERMWDVIRLRRPDAFLILGDNVYVDLPEQPGPFHDYTYYCRQSRPEFRRLTASTPVYAIWDDHEFIDDIFLGPYADKPAWKPAIFDIYRRNWNNPSYGDEPKWPGVWFNFRIGAVEFFMLDGRYYRENWMKPHPSMLGPVQKAWLKQALLKSTATFKVLVSPVAWADDAKIDTDPATGGPIEAKDTWHGFIDERTEIFDFLAANRIDGVLLLSGDRHRADLRLDPRPHGYPLYELMCSRLTNMKGAAAAGKTLWVYDEGCSFALLTFRPTGASPGLTMEVSTIEGEPLLKRDLPLSEMRDP